MRALGWALADVSSAFGNALGKPSSSVRFFLNNLFWFRMALVTGSCKEDAKVLSTFYLASCHLTHPSKGRILN